MSTTITSENDVEIRVGKLGVGVVHPEGVASIWARLSDAQRVQLAAALDPGRTPTGGQWTRNDLPRIGAAEVAHDPVVDGVLDTVVHWLNKHYPKPERSAMDYAEIIAFEAARATRTERERDESLRVKGEMVDRAVRAERERDAAVDRADAAEKRHTWPKTTPTGHTYTAPDTYSALCHQHGNAAQAAIESWDADECPPEPTWEMVGIAHREVERLQRDRDEWKARATLAEQECENWRITAINRATPAVSRADVEKAISELRTFPRFLTDELLVLRDEAIDAAWALVSGNEAEQAVDPVEEQTDALADILYGHEMVTDQMRGVLERVVRAGMLFPSEAGDE